MRSLVPLILAAALVAVSRGDDEPLRHSFLFKEPPELASFEQLQGAPVTSLSSYKGKVVVLGFFTTW